MYLSRENLGAVAQALQTELTQIPRRSYPDKPLPLEGAYFIDGKDPTGNFVSLTIQTETPFSQRCFIAIYPLKGLPKRLEKKWYPGNVT